MLQRINALDASRICIRCSHNAMRGRRLKRVTPIWFWGPKRSSSAIRVRKFTLPKRLRTRACVGQLELDATRWSALDHSPARHHLAAGAPCVSAEARAPTNLILQALTISLRAARATGVAIRPLRQAQDAAFVCFCPSANAPKTQAFDGLRRALRAPGVFD